MRFEEQVRLLCARALAAVDDSEVQAALAELRSLLHQHILHLRNGLMAAYANPKISRQTVPDGREPSTVALWRQIVHEIASEKDHYKALHLSLKLRRLLRETVNLGM